MKTLMNRIRKWWWGSNLAFWIRVVAVSLVLTVVVFGILAVPIALLSAFGINPLYPLFFIALAVVIFVVASLNQ